MAIKVETGEGLPDANSYCSLVEAEKYHETMGNTGWASLGEERQSSLLAQATQYMVAKYRMRWKGRRVKLEQSLDWPRVGVVVEDMSGQGIASFGIMQVDHTKIPNEIKNACAELALRANIGTLAKDQKQTVINKTVGPISVTYDKDASQQVKYQLIDMMLAPYLQIGGGAVKKLVRT